MPRLIGREFFIASTNTGKSLKSSVAGDIFEGLPSEALPYTRPSGYVAREFNGLSIELGGPWSFYHDFWLAHDLKVLESLVKPEAEINSGETLWVPLLIHNDTPKTKQVTVRSDTPTGWAKKSENQVYRVEPYSTYPVQFTFIAPTGIGPVWQAFSWNAETGGEKINDIQLNVYLVQPNGPRQ